MQLDTRSIHEGLAQVQRYAREFDRKVQRLRERVAETIAWTASSGFSNAVLDSVVGGSPRYANVAVSVDNKGDITIVLADGEDAVWVEFGTGVYFNGAVGTSPHPNGSGLGFTIGMFGQGKGAQDVWGFYDAQTGELIKTHGAPAAMSMYRGVVQACEHLVEIAREVFKG